MAIDLTKSLAEEYRLARDNTLRALEYLKRTEKRIGMILEDEFLASISSVDAKGDDFEESPVMYDDVFTVIKELALHCSTEMIDAMKEEQDKNPSKAATKALITALKIHRDLQDQLGAAPEEKAEQEGPTKPLFLRSRE
jgi:hypothetical protein